MKRLLGTMLVLVLAASCSRGDDGSTAATEQQLCTADEAGAAAATKAAELLKAVEQSDGASRAAACARFEDVIEDGSKADIPDLPSCRWDDRNSNGNPRFLVSLHLTQLKGRARATCGNLK
jgi:hypothetical protein